MHRAKLPTAAIATSSRVQPTTPSINSGSLYPRVIKYHAKAQNSLANAPATKAAAKCNKRGRLESGTGMPPRAPMSATTQNAARYLSVRFK
jgi:hypothetical protein